MLCAELFRLQPFEFSIPLLGRDRYRRWPHQGWRAPGSKACRRSQHSLLARVAEFAAPRAPDGIQVQSDTECAWSLDLRNANLATPETEGDCSTITYRAVLDGRQRWVAAMAFTETRSLSKLLARLGDDSLSRDTAVVSVIASRDQTGSWSLLYGSVLFGPTDMATSSWLDWCAASGDRFAAQAKASLNQHYSSLVSLRGSAPLPTSRSSMSRILRRVLSSARVRRETTTPSSLARLAEGLP